MMLIYIFAEHYPTPYKPQFDTEFAFLVRQGHDIKIFVGGQYLSTLHPRVREFDLHNKTYLIPTTLKTVRRFSGRLLMVLITSPRLAARRLRQSVDRHRSMKENFLRFAWALLLPRRSPDLCYVHNIATAVNVDLLRRVFPSSRHMLYFHGGEVGGVRRVADADRLFAEVDVVLTNTEFGRKQAVERGCPPGKVFSLPVGFDLSDYSSGGVKEYRRGGVLRLISVGRLSKEKGLVYSIEAVRQLVEEGHRSIHYTIVGRGLQDNFLKTWVAEKGIGQFVEFAGEVDKAGVVTRLAEADVLLLPSVVTDTWAETQAAVVQEAMFMRLLVIGTKTGGVPESTAPVLRPYSVPPFDSAAIAQKIRDVLQLPDDEMRALGNAGREFAVHRFDIEEIGPRLLQHASGSGRR